MITVLSRHKQWLMIEFIIFYCVLSSARASCTFGQNTYIDLFLSLIVLVFFSTKGYFKTSFLKMMATTFLVLAILWTMHGLMIHAYFGEVATAAIPIMILNIKRDKQLELLVFLSKALAIVLLVSLIAWILSFWGFILPASTTYADLDYTYGVINENHFLYLKVVNLDSGGNEIIRDIVRFNGIFLEPGHTGTIVTFFLVANKYDFSKWYVKILILIVVITLSAAAYVLAILGYVLTVICQNKSRKILIRLLLLFGLLCILSQYNDGDNIINNVVFDKLFNSNRGLDKRFTGEVSNAYNRLWMHGDYLFGLSSKVNVEHSAGYKVFLIQQGLLGAFLVFIAYYLMHKITNTRMGFLFFVLVMVSFLQRVYFTWDAFLIPYILGLSNFKGMSSKSKTK